MKICFLIRKLDVGGAERQLVLLARGLHDRGHAVSVLVYHGGGQLEELLVRAGIPIVVIGKNGRWDLGGFCFRLVRAVRRAAPDVIHSYLHISNCLSATLKPFFSKGTRIVWGIRSSGMDLKQYGWLPRLVCAAASRVARYADLIIVNSFAARDYNLAREFPGDKMVVIHNGFDTEVFRRDDSRRSEIRGAWRVAADMPLVGLVGRFDRMKDHPTFLRAAALVARENPSVKFLCLGNGEPGYILALQELARQLGLSDRLIWSQSRSDMAAVYNALDLLCSSSAFGEGLSNVVGEAMACGVPCVVTDVGDSRYLVGDTGIVVPPGDPAALARGILATISPAARQLAGRQAGERICRYFSAERLVLTTEEKLLPLTMTTSR